MMNVNIPSRITARIAARRSRSSVSIQANRRRVISTCANCGMAVAENSNKPGLMDRWAAIVARIRRRVAEQDRLEVLFRTPNFRSSGDNGGRSSSSGLATADIRIEDDDRRASNSRRGKGLGGEGLAKPQVISIDGVIEPNLAGDGDSSV